MIDHYDRILKLVAESHTREELDLYPDYDWLIYNLISFIKADLLEPPNRNDNSYWGKWFWAYCTQTANDDYAMALNEFKSPPSKVFSRIMFNATPDTLKDKFYMFLLNL